MSEAKSDRSEEPAKKSNDDFSFHQMKDAKSECLPLVSIYLLMALSVAC